MQLYNEVIYNEEHKHKTYKLSRAETFAIFSNFAPIRESLCFRKSSITVNYRLTAPDTYLIFKNLGWAVI